MFQSRHEITTCNLYAFYTHLFESRLKLLWIHICFDKGGRPASSATQPLKEPQRSIKRRRCSTQFLFFTDRWLVDVCQDPR